MSSTLGRSTPNYSRDGATDAHDDRHGNAGSPREFFVAKPVHPPDNGNPNKSKDKAQYCIFDHSSPTSVLTQQFATLKSVATRDRVEIRISRHFR